MRSSRNNNKSTSLQEAALLFLMLVVLYVPVFRGLIDGWNIKPEASHGYLILPISLFLVWQNRERLTQYEPEGEKLGLVLILSGLSLYFVGVIAEISTLSNISLLFNVFGILLSILGRKITRVLIFPVIFLVFMIPVPDVIYVSLTAPLKLFVSAVSSNIMQLLGIPVMREGNIFYLANISFEVVEACSGLRSLISYLVLSTLLAYFLPPNTMGKKVLLVAITLPTALLVNILRIVITGFLSNRWGKKMAEGFFHESSGIMLFFIGASMLFGIFFLMGGFRGSDKGLMNEHRVD